ncbi:hypothetical protein [Kitasatospora sp. NPDC098663]|uniref:hypothetical protein n=1 Tax=Kitasatospora sp. NPDC098663 TaxID=3364096 RepID=UPI003823C1B6
MIADTRAVKAGAAGHVFGGREELPRRDQRGGYEQRLRDGGVADGVRLTESEPYAAARAAAQFERAAGSTALLAGRKARSNLMTWEYIGRAFA